MSRKQPIIVFAIKIPIFITYDDEWHLEQYKSYESRQSVLSPLATETQELADASYITVMLQHDVQRITGSSLSITLLTDQKLLLDVISKGSKTPVYRLMIDVRASRDAYDQEVWSHLGWILQKFNLSDALMKVENREMMKSFTEKDGITVKSNNTSLEPYNSHKSYSERDSSTTYVIRAI